MQNNCYIEPNDEFNASEMIEGKTLRMDTDSRSKFYVSGKVSSKVRSFHAENNEDKQLWFTVEQLLEAGLSVLSEQKQAA